MLLRAGYIALAYKLQEAATAVSMEEIRNRISACIREHYEEIGGYGWLVDVMGDDKSGKCVYSCDSGFEQADYKLRTTDSKATCTIDFENAIGVVPHTTYKATESVKPTIVSRETIPVTLAETEPVVKALQIVETVPLSEVA